MSRRALQVGLLLSLVACDQATKPVSGPVSSSTSASSPAAAAASPPPAPAAPAPAAGETKPLAVGSNAFAVDLWPRVAKPGDNVAFSPASVSLALAMTWAGAKGETAAQMKRVMHFEGDQDATATGWGRLARALASPGRPLQLRIANRLFGERSYAFLPAYLDKTQRAFGAPLEPTDFKGAFEPARGRINGWVEEQTERRIANLLPRGALDAMTRLVLVNAIYFLADWAEPFEKEMTRDAPFEVSEAAKRVVPTMHHRGVQRVGEVDGALLVELPYKGDDASMLVVVPKKRHDLAAIERALSPAKIDAWRAALASREVLLALPRFEVAPPTVALEGELKALGMTAAFDREAADFTAIADPPDRRDRLHVSKVFHKAFVKVDEKGTEAAAATAVVMAKGGGAPSKVDEVKVDQPFLFFIVDRASGLVLFMGRVVDPSVR